MPPLPPVTKAFMLVCTALFCVQMLLGPWFERLFALWPLASGAFMPWQVLSYALLHGGIAHLFFNMLGIWLFGGELERLWGQKRYVHFLIASALAAAAVQLVWTWVIGSNAPTLGASGALLGLLLAYGLVFPNRQFDLLGFLPMLLMLIPSTIFNIAGMVLFFVMLTNRSALPIAPIPIPAKVMVLAFGAIELFLGVLGSSGIAHFAHLGGMLGGFLMLRYWRGQTPFRRR